MDSIAPPLPFGADGNHPSPERKQNTTKRHEIISSGCDCVWGHKKNQATSVSSGPLPRGVIGCMDFAMSYAGRRCPAGSVVRIGGPGEGREKGNLVETTPKPHVAQRACGMYKICVLPCFQTPRSSRRISLGEATRLVLESRFCLTL